MASVPFPTEDLPGLRQLYPQSDSVETSYDLVFVHGLAGGPVSTWRHENGALWLEWLSLARPSLRILVYGYNASRVYLKSDDAVTSTDRVFTFAESLCSWLRFFRIKRKNPITFVGHGVGGIIIKNALVYCTNRRSQFGDIVDYTHHVVFLDTPHLGLDTDRWRAVYGSLATPQAKSQFQLWSTALQDLSTTFADIINRPWMHVTTVESTEPVETPDGQMMVMPVGSARLFNTNNEITLHMSDVSHLTMCRFDRVEHSNYILLQSAILTEIEIQGSSRNHQSQPLADIHPLTLNLRTDSELQNLAQLAQESSKKLGQILQGQAQSKFKDLQAEIEHRKLQRRADREKLLAWLWPYQDRHDESNISWARDLEQASVAIDDTCTWIFKHPQYVSWREAPSSSIALLRGIPGCGKSTTLAFLINDLQRQGKAVSYFFCNGKISSPVTRLRALSYQLLQRLSDDLVVQLLADRYEKMPDTVGTVAAAKGIFKDALMASPSCTVAIDAVDEIPVAQKAQARFIKALVELVRDIPFDLKIICSSRIVQSIFNQFALARPDMCDITITPELIRDDIRVVISNEITQSGLGAKLQSEEQVNYITDTLLQGSQGMFLLPVMMIKDFVSKSTLQSIYDFFGELPTDLHQYYSSILDKIDSSRLGIDSASDTECYGKRVLLILTWGKSNLSFTQLKEALSFDGTRFLDLDSDIKMAFGCLIMVEDGQIKLSHPSVRRYLLKSQSFRGSKWYDRLTTPDPEGSLADLCLRYLEYCTLSPLRPSSRFAITDVLAMTARYPFLEYASTHWVSHCSAARFPRTLVPRIRDLVCSVDFRRLLEWYFAAIHFFEGGVVAFESICRGLQTFVLGLQTLVGREDMDTDLQQQIYSIDGTLRLLLRFQALWGLGASSCPGELFVLAPLVKDPYSMVGQFRQQSLLLQDFASTTNHQEALLDKRHLDDQFDRFLLTDMSIFMWNSLMPCTPYERRYHYPLDPAEPLKIKFRLERIKSTIHAGEERGGKDYAEVGAFPASCVLSRSRKSVAVVWPRASEDKDGPIWLKTYLWNLPEDENDYFLVFVHWTVAEIEDPCRADLTLSHTFKKTRLAIAFTENSLQLWTAGGLYDIDSGRHHPPPDLFYDTQMSELTFAEHGTAIAGLRQSTRLEVYELHADYCQLRSSTSGVDHILALSPRGKFTLFLARSTSPVGLPYPMPHSDEEVGLLLEDGRSLILWRYASVATSGSPVEEQDLRDVPSLQYFYNNGGLQAFSDNEAILVLCVPTMPVWSLLAFDLQAHDIIGSAWKVEYSDLFDGADLTTFSFSRTRDHQLYLLDAFGNLRTLLISRPSEMKSSTVIVGKQPMLLSGVAQGSPTWYLCSTSIMPMALTPGRAHFASDNIQAAFAEPSFRTSQIDLRTLQYEQMRRKTLSLAPVRHFQVIQSNDLVIDYDAVLNFTAQNLYYSPYTWSVMAADAQAAIEDTTNRIRDVIEELSLEPEESLKDKSPRVKTSISFDQNLTRAFFHSVVYNPVVSKRGQPRWMLTMIMGIRSTATRKARKTGKWMIGIVGTVSQENMARAYHEGHKTLAFSVSLLYIDRGAETHSWYLSRLCICTLFESLYQDSQTDPRGTFLESLSYSLSDPCITEIRFSEDGKYLYGISQGLSTGAFQFDVGKGMTVRKISINDDFKNMSFVSMGDEMYLIAAHGPRVLQTTLPFETKEKVKLRQVFTGPHIQQNCEKLKVFIPASAEEPIVAVFSGLNYLRKDGVEGGNTLEPVVLSALEKDVGSWQEVDITSEAVSNSDCDAKQLLRDAAAKIDKSFNDWVARTKGAGARAVAEPAAQAHHGGNEAQQQVDPSAATQGGGDLETRNLDIEDPSSNRSKACVGEERDSTDKGVPVDGDEALGEMDPDIILGNDV